MGKRESESEREEEERGDEKEPTDSSHEFVKLRGFQFHRCRGSVCHGANVTGHFFDFRKSFVSLFMTKKKLEKRDEKKNESGFCVQF